MSDTSDYWDGTDAETTAPAEQEQNPEDYFKVGLLLLKRNKAGEALIAFRHAVELKKGDPRYMSYFGLCLALAGGKVKEGMLLCEKAAQKEFFRAELFLNLGRVYLKAGNRKKAHMALRKGLALDRESTDIKQELRLMGVRKPPVLPFLDRKNAINMLAGKVLHRLRIR